MRVVHINKSDAGGGAAVAALRIHRALMRSGADSHFLTQDKRRSEDNEVAVGAGRLYEAANFARFAWERLTFLPYEKENSLRYNFSPANVGRSLARHPEVQQADIIHLHWINQGYLSLDGLAELFALGKPVVWTLHDMWAFTGGCHYAGSCLEFNEHCGHCPFLRKPHASDISAAILARKRAIYSKANLTAVACSRWLRSMASSSTLLQYKPVFNIPNSIDTRFYHPLDRNECRRKLGLPLDKKLIMFGAANLLDVRKGFRYLIEALRIMKDSFPALADRIELVVFGKLSADSKSMLSFNFHSLSFVSDPSRLVEIYNAADVFVLPSLQDNLPNTVVESLSCGTPVVGFEIGGVPEMVEHGRTGFLAEPKNSLSLANGLYQVLFFDAGGDLRQASRRHAIESFSEENVAQQYINVYQSVLQK